MSQFLAALIGILGTFKAILSWMKKRPIEMVQERKRKLDEMRKRFKKD